MITGSFRFVLRKSESLKLWLIGEHSEKPDRVFRTLLNWNLFKYIHFVNHFPSQFPHPSGQSVMSENLTSTASSCFLWGYTCSDTPSSVLRKPCVFTRSTYSSWSNTFMSKMNYMIIIWWLYIIYIDIYDAIHIIYIIWSLILEKDDIFSTDFSQNSGQNPGSNRSDLAAAGRYAQYAMVAMCLHHSGPNCQEISGVFHGFSGDFMA